MLLAVLCGLSVAADEPPVDPEPCDTCKTDCRAERDDEFEHCSSLYPVYEDPQRSECLKSVVRQHTLCLEKECYGDPEHPGPCLNSLFVGLGVGVQFVAGNPNVPTQYEFQLNSDSTGTYYLTTANIGAIVANGTPLSALTVTINGQTVIDDPQYDQQTDTSQQVSLHEGVNIIAVSSDATGEVELLVTDQPAL